MGCTRVGPGVGISLLRPGFSGRESCFVRVCVPRCFKSRFGMLCAPIWRASGWFSGPHGPSKTVILLSTSLKIRLFVEVAYGCPPEASSGSFFSPLGSIWVPPGTPGRRLLQWCSAQKFVPRRECGPWDRPAAFPGSSRPHFD